MFAGTYTAIVTPFNQNGSVDFGKLRDFVAWQAASGVEGIVPVGTTGESPTLDVEEHIEVIRVSVEAGRGRLQVIAGTGANSTSEALDLTRRVLDLGCQATLQVTPYYNKPNAEGLYRHSAPWPISACRSCSTTCPAAAAGRSRWKPLPAWSNTRRLSP
jgi:4-hydroxy-tetrahydrodipicolinate synthase